MKWIFLALMLVLTPVLIGQLRANPKTFPAVGFLIGLGPFIMVSLHLFVAPISWAGWQGTVKGLEISFLDALAVAILLVTKPVKISNGLKVPLGIIAFALVTSSIAADDMTPSLFYVWQFARAVLLCVAVARATAAYPTFPNAILSGYAAGMVYLAISVALQFGQGDIQAGGLFGHQNLSGLVTMFIVFPALTLLVMGRRIKTALLIMACEVVVAFGGGSRATIGLLGAGIVITLLLSIWHHPSGRKTAAMVGTFFALAIAAPIMLTAIERRSESARAGSVDERQKFEDAAGMIVRDHPLGVGANRYVVTANLGGYSDRAGVPWNWSERSAPVHNAYYLIAAETGILGLFGYVSLFASVILLGLRALRRKTNSESSELLVGFTASAIVTTVYYAFEWVPMVFQVHYLAATNTGVLIGLAFVVGTKRTMAPIGSSFRRRPAQSPVSV